MENIALKEITDFSSLLTEFPNTLVTVEWEAVNLDNPYEELTIQFGKASRGNLSL
jgi:hypothetical protein